MNPAAPSVALFNTERDIPRSWSGVGPGNQTFASGGHSTQRPRPSRVSGLVQSGSQTPTVRHGPAIFVASFEAEGDPRAFPNFTRGFTREATVALTRFNDLFVFGPDTTFRLGGEDDIQRIVADLEVDFILTGGTMASGDNFTVDALLTGAKSGQYIRAARFEGTLDAESILKARDEVPNQVARSLAQPDGVIFANQVTENGGKPPESLISYDCVTRLVNDVKRSLEAARTGPALNPNDTELMADVGTRYAWRNQ